MKNRCDICSGNYPADEPGSLFFLVTRRFPDGQDHSVYASVCAFCVGQVAEKALEARREWKEQAA
jgi:hypothetical protein